MRILHIVLLGILITTSCSLSDKSSNLNKQNDANVSDLESRSSDSNKRLNIDSLISATPFQYELEDTIKVGSLKNEFLTDSLLKKVLNKGKYNETYNYSAGKIGELWLLTLLENEGETISIQAFLIKNGKLIDNIIVAEFSQWEHGIKETKSVVDKDNYIEKLIYSASKDWGDYSTWKHDTIIEKIKISSNGFQKVD